MDASEAPEQEPMKGLRWFGWIADSGMRWIAILTAVVVLALIIYPISRMLIRAFSPDGEANFFSIVVRTTELPWFWTAVGNTAIAVGVSGVLAILIAAIFAWLNERTDASLGAFGTFIPILPLVIPAVAMAVGWIFLASPRVGFLNGLLDWLNIDFTIDVQTWAGLIFLYTLSLVPFAYVVLAAAFRNIDPSLEEAAQVGGAGFFRMIRTVSLPTIKPAILGATFLVGVMGLGLYSIPLIIGTRANIDILSVRLVRLMKFEFPPQLETAIVLGIFLAIPIFLAWFFQQRVVKSNNFGVVGGRSRTQRLELGKLKLPARIAMVTYLVLTSVLPLIALLIVAFQKFWTPAITLDGFTLDHVIRALFINPTTSDAIRTSILLGLGIGAATMALSTVLALVTRRLTRLGPRAGALGRALDGITKLPIAFSNVVIALGFVVAFSGPPFSLNGTILILVLCYFVLYLPHASIAAGSAMSQVGGELLEASEVSGASESRTFRRVLLPLMWPGIIGGWALVFVLVSGDLEAAALLATTNTPVIGFVIVDIWEYGNYGQMAAFVGVVTVIKGFLVGLLILLSRQRFRSLH